MESPGKRNTGLSRTMSRGTSIHHRLRCNQLFPPNGALNNLLRFEQKFVISGTLVQIEFPFGLVERLDRPQNKIVVKNQPPHIEALIEHESSQDAEERLLAAFEMIFAQRSDESTNSI